MKIAAPAASVALAVGLAGCGGSTASHAGRTVTVGAYAGFPATTIVGHYDAAHCAADAEAVEHDAFLYFQHTVGGAPPPADLYYIDMEQNYAHFRADACTPAELGGALRRGLTARQRRYLLGNLSTDLVDAFRGALSVS